MSEGARRGRDGGDETVRNGNGVKTGEDETRNVLKSEDEKKKKGARRKSGRHDDGETRVKQARERIFRAELILRLILEYLPGVNRPMMIAPARGASLSGYHYTRMYEMRQRHTTIPPQ